MLGYNKNFELKITVTDQQKKTALEGFAAMNRRMVDMIAYLEKPDVAESELKKYEPMYINALSAVSQSYIILKAMGVPEQEIKKHCKF